MGNLNILLSENQIKALASLPEWHLWSRKIPRCASDSALNSPKDRSFQFSALPFLVHDFHPWNPHGPGWLLELHSWHLDSRQAGRRKGEGTCPGKSFPKVPTHPLPPPSVPNVAIETSTAPVGWHLVLSFLITVPPPPVWGSATSKMHWRKVHHSDRIGCPPSITYS